LENAEPSFHVIHPGAMHRREVDDKAGMLGSPLADFLSMMCADMVAHEMDHAEVGSNPPGQGFQQGDAFLWPVAFITLPIDLAGAGIEGGKEIEGPGALGRVLPPVRKRLGRGGPGWVLAGPRWEGGLLIHGEDHCILPERARVAVDALGDRGRARGVTGLLGVEPEMMAPGLACV
jgi:hypothetical protein